MNLIKRRILPCTSADAISIQKKLEREKLQQQYPHEFVALDDEQVIDHDSNQSDLVWRVYHAFGSKPIYIKNVDEPLNVRYSIPSAFSRRT